MNAKQKCPSKYMFSIRDPKLNIDLFASRVSQQLPKYVAWNLDPFSIVTDALLVLLRQKNFYTFAPFCVIPLVLSKIIR